MKTTKSANEASPDVYAVLLSNEHVNVLEMKLDPGKIDNWHRQPLEAVYFVRGGKGQSDLSRVPDHQHVYLYQRYQGQKRP